MHSASGDGHFFRADHISRTKVTTEPSAGELHNSRCLLADALESNKAIIARHIIFQLSCPPEAATKLAHEILSICSARAIMHRQSDCSRPCDSLEWLEGKYYVDFYAYVLFFFDVPLYVAITGSRMASFYSMDDIDQLCHWSNRKCCLPDDKFWRAIM